jgi:hypothetical protein
MWYVAIFKFVWNNFWKMATAASWLAFVWFVDSIQQPAKVQARISNIEAEQKYLRDDNLSLKIRTGTSEILFKQIDGKLDKANESIIILSQKVGQLISKP